MQNWFSSRLTEEFWNRCGLEWSVVTGAPRNSYRIIIDGFAFAFVSLSLSGCGWIWERNVCENKM